MSDYLKTADGVAPLVQETDIEKFKQRYDLSADDFTRYDFNGELWIFLNEGITLADDPPIFEPPDIED